MCVHYITVFRRVFTYNSYIDDDLTVNEREIQSNLRNIAREERAKGNEVKVGYQKIMINNQWVNWNTLSQQTTT